LIIVNSTTSSREEAISELAEKLILGGYAKPSFTQAVLLRENSFPTGLPVYPIGVAIPHADIKHILIPAIAISILAKPVSFCTMSDPDTLVDVKILFMLAMKETHAQLELLKSLIQFIQDQNKLIQLIEATTAQEVLEQFNFNEIKIG